MGSTSNLKNSQINKPGGWQGITLKEFRKLVKEAAPKIVEEIKWRKPSNSMLGIPVWSYNGIICTGETYKDKVKFTFAYGALLKDPVGLFNTSLQGKERRAIDIHYGDKLNKAALKALIQEAVALNLMRNR